MNSKFFKKNTFDDNLMKISPLEVIRYKIAEKLDYANQGDKIDLNDVFGDSVSPDEYMEFIKMGGHDDMVYPKSKEDFDEALKKVEEEPIEIDILKVAYGYMLGTVVEQDFAEAFKWFMKAAEMGNSEAMDRIGGSYSNGFGVEKNIDKALDWYKRSIITDGNADALLDLALCYVNGTGVKANYKTAFMFMERSAKQGCGAAQYNLGYFYRMGMYVEKDMDKALYWYGRSAKNNYVESVIFMQNYCLKNSDMEGFYKWTLKLVDLDHEYGYYNMGVFYREGDIVEKDLQKSFEMFTKAAEHDYAPAQYELAIIYGKGLYGKEDMDKSWNYLVKAANQRYTLAEYVIGTMLWNDDRENAIRYMTDAAQQGYNEAIVFLQTHE